MQSSSVYPYPFFSYKSGHYHVRIPGNKDWLYTYEHYHAKQFLHEVNLTIVVVALQAGEALVFNNHRMLMRCPGGSSLQVRTCHAILGCDAGFSLHPFENDLIGVLLSEGAPPFDSGF